MRHFGLYSSVIFYFGLLILSYSVSKYFLYNGVSFELNLLGIGILCSLFYLVVMPNYKAKPILVFVIYSLVTVAMLNFFSSSLIDFFERGLDDNNARGMSWIVILPTNLIAGVIWGYFFDRRANRIAKPCCQ